jgi:subtilisin family serine protease
VAFRGSHLLWLLTFAPARAEAQVDVSLLVSRLQRPSAVPARVPRALHARDGNSVALIVERTGPHVAPPAGAVSLSGNFFALTAPVAQAQGLSALHPGYRFHWAPPRRLLLDRAGHWTRAEGVRRELGASGRGVVIGVIDTGLDVMHADLRNPQGGTRVRWLIELGERPAGLHPELEAELGCQGRAGCAIYAESDINRLIDNAVAGDEPQDAFGHGTHVTSLAAGNGRSHQPPRYVGVAPEADLIVARVAEGSESAILDGDVLRAARFIFERARELGAPAVLNLSLGSDFGAHDGHSPLERALSELVGPEHPGRAIVVAAGNSGGVYRGLEARYPEPLGIHTEVHVPRAAPVTVPVLTAPGPSDRVRAGVFVWLRFRAGDELRVGVERRGASLVKPVAPGEADSRQHGELEVTVLNGVVEESGALDRREPSAVVMLEGEWTSGETFGLRLEGHGTASIWLQSTGDLDPTVSYGALLPFARKEGTINVPASAPELIAVGATVNRTEWTDWQGQRVLNALQAGSEPLPADSTAPFSSAGPNALGVLKPDLVAPGANLIGALARHADPRSSARASLFSGEGQCAGNSECFVIDESHGLASGTSMAAPLVAGAIALLFERDPTLTQDQARALLQAGARWPDGVVSAEQQLGAGALDVEGAINAQLADDSPSLREPSRNSWISLATSYARPDPEWPLEGLAELRGTDGRLADGFASARLQLVVSGGSIHQPLRRLAPGLYHFALLAAPNSGGRTLRMSLRFDEATIAERELPIAVDAGAASGGVGLRGGCAVGPPQDVDHAWWLALVGFAELVRRRIRRLPG